MKSLNEILDGLTDLREQDRELFDDAVTMLIYLDEAARNTGWEILSRVSKAYAGSDLYLKGRNGMIHSRASGQTMPLDKAVEEFITQLELDAD